MDLNRRDVVKLAAFGSLGVAGLALPVGVAAQTKGVSTLAAKNFPKPYAAPFRRPPVLKPYRSDRRDDGTIAKAYYSVCAKEGSASFVPGLTTRVWGYNGIVPGPVIKVDQGTEVSLRVRNQLPTLSPLHGKDFYTSTHLHGSASLPQFDGYADDLTYPGSYKMYEYPNFQEARTLWYHDHGVHYTAQNVYGGLAAQYHLHDPFERAQLPQGEFDVPITLSDAIFQRSGELGFDERGFSGLWGDVILVNGAPWPTMEVKPRVYRFRILNGCVSRSFRHKLSTGDPFHLVATDAGLVPVVQRLSTFRHGSAERYEVLVDFRRFTPGTLVTWTNLSNKNNRDYDHTGKVMRFKVVADTAPPDPYVIPSELDRGPIPEAAWGARDPMTLTANDAVRRRFLDLERDDVTNEFKINGLTWKDVQDQDLEPIVSNPQQNDVELWTLENKSGGWFHPMHIHLVDFRVLTRNGKPPLAHELGPKDTVYVGEGEIVKVVMQFHLPQGNTGGRYMLHCHNLAHEDHDMMQQFAVQDPRSNDPVKSVYPVGDDLEPDDPRYDNDDDGDGG